MVNLYPILINIRIIVLTMTGNKILVRLSSLMTHSDVKQSLSLIHI